jgi:hypothetical protein
MFTRLLDRSRRFVLFSFLAVMPLGVALEEDRPGDLTVGLHGGGGQVITVIRDCNGRAISTQDHPFNDIEGSLEYSRDYGRNDTRWVIGLRGGQVRIRRNDHGHFGATGEHTYKYWSPYGSIEDHNVGIGLGYLGGNLPTFFDGDDVDFRLTGHLRIGSLDGGHFLFALNESRPLLTGGGPWVLGAGYAPGSRVRGFTGLSAGWYEGLGIAQRLSIVLTDRAWLDFGFRIASTESNFDGGGSVGIRYRIPTK